MGRPSWTQFRTLVIVACMSSVAAADDKFALTFQSSIFGGDDSIYLLKLDNGLMWRLGIPGAQNIEGMAMMPDGRILAIDAFIDDFWDVTRLPGTLVGPTGPRFGVDAGLAYNPVNGTLYNLSGADNFDFSHTWIYRVNPDTGDTTFLSENTTTYADSLAINANGVSYAADHVFTNRFFRVNLGTGAFVTVGSLGMPGTDQLSLAFDGVGTLWALSGGDSDIYTINPQTGQGTFVTNMQFQSFRWGGLVVLPTRPGDCDGDGDTDFADFVAFQRCAGGADEDCACSDITRDKVTDLDDFDVFIDIINGPVGSE